jgi:hypothetical protein
MGERLHRRKLEIFKLTHYDAFKAAERLETCR